MIEWSEGLSVGIHAIDDQHCALLNILNQLEGMMLSESSSDDLHTICRDIAVYCERHFLDEETLMREASYPLLAEHARKHRSIHTHINALLDRRKEGVDVSKALVRLLNAQVDVHLKTEDMEFAEWLRKTETLRRMAVGEQLSALIAQPRRNAWWRW